MKSSLNNQKGVSLIFIIFLASIIVSIALGLSIVTFSQIKMMRNIGDSELAFYITDTVAERHSYIFLKKGADYFKNNFLPVPATYTSFDSFLTGASYSYRVYCPSAACQTAYTFPTNINCVTDNFCLQSFGAYKGISRAMEIIY